MQNNKPMFTWLWFYTDNSNKNSFRVKGSPGIWPLLIPLGRSLKVSGEIYVPTTPFAVPTCSHTHAHNR